MESIGRVGNFLMTIRATDSFCQDLSYATKRWISYYDTVDYCVVFPTYTMHKDFEGVRRIVRTDTGEVIRKLIPNRPVRALDNIHIIDIEGGVINMETLETYTHEEWITTHQSTPLMQVEFLSQDHESASLIVTSYGGLTSNLPLLQLTNYTENVFYYVIDNFLIVSISDSDTTAELTPIARGNLVLERTEVIGNFYIFQIRGHGLHTKPAARRDADDE